MGELTLKCRCGAMRGLVLDLPKSVGARMVCYCDDCQAAAHYVGQAGTILDGHGGTEILAIPPSQFKITQGAEHLKCFRLSEKGMLRWYAGCCRTSLANSPTSSKLPYVGLVSSFYAGGLEPKQRDQLLTPLRFRVMGKFAIGQPPAGTASAMAPAALFSIVGFLILGFWRKKQKPSPLFDAETGQPLAVAYILSAQERDGLRRLCGPNPKA